jgi:hypothetical protein
LDEDEGGAEVGEDGGDDEDPWEELGREGKRKEEPSSDAETEVIDSGSDVGEMGDPGSGRGSLSSIGSEMGGDDPPALIQDIEYNGLFFPGVDPSQRRAARLRIASDVKWDKATYGLVDESTMRTASVYVFTEMTKGKNKLPFGLRVKRFITKHTPLGAVEDILPANGGDVALTELKRETVKTSEGMKWFWEKHFTTYAQEDLYHAFSTAYSHASKVLVYARVAKDFLSSPTIGTLECLDKDALTVRSVAQRYVLEYMSQHPFYHIMCMYPEVYQNTLGHIHNQLVIIGLRARARSIVSSDKGYGVIGVPGSTGVFGRARQLPFSKGSQPQAEFRQYFRGRGRLGVAPPSATPLELG